MTSTSYFMVKSSREYLRAKICAVTKKLPTLWDCSYIDREGTVVGSGACNAVFNPTLKKVPALLCCFSLFQLHNSPSQQLCYSYTNYALLYVTFYVFFSIILLFQILLF